MAQINICMYLDISFLYSWENLPNCSIFKMHKTKHEARIAQRGGFV